MKKYYVGITIGPIFDTVKDASTPAALWFASSLFSDVTKRLCDEILKLKGYETIEIHSPYYSDEIRTDDGVGKFHDRVIVSVVEEQMSPNGKETLMHALSEIVSRVKEGTVYLFHPKIVKEETKTFLNQYLKIHFVVLDEHAVGEENCVLALSPYLDSLELMKTFPMDHFQNPIRRTFMGEKDNRNVYIKESPLFQKIQKAENQFRGSKDSIWTVEDIASCHGKAEKGKKSSRYFAVIHADGDGMGNFLSGLGNEKITDFSKACLNYAEAASKQIAEFGGMTIYAGGDDLLFLAPVADKNGKTIFQLCNEIQNTFAEMLNKEETIKGTANRPTLSFGIAVRYVKFPLYEALDASRNLLYKAKELGGKKNRMAIDVQKHSGQSAAVAVSNQSCQKMLQFFEISQDVPISENAEERMSESLLYTIHTFKPLLRVLCKNVRNGQLNKQQFLSAWMNLVDNPEQKKYQTYFKKMGEIFYQYFLDPNVQNRMEALLLEKKEKNPELIIFETMLRIKKFLNEKGEEA